MPNQETLYHATNRVATITLNRPDKLNAWTAVMEREVRAAMGEAEHDEKVRVIVLTGAGRGFCGGADMSLLSTVAEKGLDEATAGPSSATCRQWRRGNAKGLSEEILLFQGGHKARDCGYQRAGSGLGIGDCIVLRYTSCLVCGSVRDGFCAARADRRVRNGVDVAATRGTRQRAGFAV